jgi:hypothetical protein
MPTEDQRQTSRRRENLPDPYDTDSIIELSLNLARAARKQFPLRRYQDDEE